MEQKLKIAAESACVACAVYLTGEGIPAVRRGDLVSSEGVPIVSMSLGRAAAAALPPIPGKIRERLAAEGRAELEMALAGKGIDGFDAERDLEEGIRLNIAMHRLKEKRKGVSFRPIVSLQVGGDVFVCRADREADADGEERLFCPADADACLDAWTGMLYEWVFRSAAWPGACGRLCGDWMDACMDFMSEAFPLLLPEPLSDIDGAMGTVLRLKGMSVEEMIAEGRIRDECARIASAMGVRPAFLFACEPDQASHSFMASLHGPFPNRVMDTDAKIWEAFSLPPIWSRSIGDRSFGFEAWEPEGRHVCAAERSAGEAACDMLNAIGASPDWDDGEDD